MNRKSPDQALFDALFAASRELGNTTYPLNPPKGASYPFVRIGDVQLVPIATKSYLLGRMYATVDVWGDGKSRKRVADIAQSLMEAFSRLKAISGGYEVSLNYNTSSVHILADNSTEDDLWRARISLEFMLR